MRPQLPRPAGDFLCSPARARLASLLAELADHAQDVNDIHHAVAVQVTDWAGLTQEFQMWSLKTSGMEALADCWALENPVADRLKPRFRDHLDLLGLTWDAGKSTILTQIVIIVSGGPIA